MRPRKPPIQPDNEDGGYEELDDIDELRWIVGESTLAEAPIPDDAQTREVLRLADENPIRTDEETLLALRVLEKSEIRTPDIRDDDEDLEGPASDEGLDVRIKRERHRHQRRRARATSVPPTIRS